MRLWPRKSLFQNPPRIKRGAWKKLVSDQPATEQPDDKPPETLLNRVGGLWGAGAIVAALVTSAAVVRTMIINHTQVKQEIAEIEQQTDRLIKAYVATSPEVKDLTTIVDSRKNDKTAAITPEQDRAVMQITERLHRMPLVSPEIWIQTRLKVYATLERDPVLLQAYRSAQNRIMMQSMPVERASDDVASMSIGSYQLVDLGRSSR